MPTMPEYLVGETIHEYYRRVVPAYDKCGRCPCRSDPGNFCTLFGEEIVDGVKRQICAENIVHR